MQATLQIFIQVFIPFVILLVFFTISCGFIVLHCGVIIATQVQWFKIRTHLASCQNALLFFLRPECFAGNVLPISCVLTNCNGCVLCAMREPQRVVSQFDWLFFFSNFAVSIFGQPLIVIDLSRIAIRCLIIVVSLTKAMNWGMVHTE